MSKAAQQKLRAILDAEPNTAAFLSDVISVLEALYADDDEGCAKGFDALDKAREAFEEAEREADE
jgi:hypothetical protein